MTDWPVAWLLAGLAKDAHEFQNPKDLHQATKVHKLDNLAPNTDLHKKQAR